MSTQLNTDFPIDETVVDGTELARILERFNDAFNSLNSTTVRPDYLLAGGIWSKSLGDDDYQIMVYDGTTDIALMKIKDGLIYETNVFTWNASREYQVGDIAIESNVLYVSLTANTNKQPSSSTSDWSRDRVTVNNTLSSTSTTEALSAYMGKWLDYYKIQADDYATSTKGGTLKMRVSSGVLYLRNDGVNA